MPRSSPARSPAPTRRRKSPSEIAPGVFVGGWSDAVEFAGRRYCVLDERPDGELPADEQLAIYDEKADAPILPNLERVSGWVEAARKAGEPVLLFCGHGVRRSPLAGAWYLHRHDRIPLSEAYARIREVRPRVEEAREWIGHWQSLESNP